MSRSPAPEERLRILLVEDNPSDARLIREAFRDVADAFEVTLVGSLRDAVAQLAKEQFNLILADLGLPDSSGMDTVERLANHAPTCPLVVLTGDDDEKLGLQALKLGAQDYLVKGSLGSGGLAKAAIYAVERARAQNEVAAARADAAAASAREAAALRMRWDLEREVSKRRQAQRELTRQVTRIEALRTVDAAILSSVGTSPVLDVALAQAKLLLNVDAGSVLLRTEGSSTLEVAATVGFATDAYRTRRFEVGTGLSGRCALERLPITIPDLRLSREEFVNRDVLEAEAFVGYHAVPLVAKGVLHGVFEYFARVPLDVDEDWTSFAQTLAGQTAIAIDSARMFARSQQLADYLVHAYDATIEGWARALDLRDRETEGHSRRVTELATDLSRRMGFIDEELVNVRRGALLHDIGKMGVPDAILQKPGPLTPEERQVMELHPKHAYDLLIPIRYLHSAVDIPYGHHEKWDGSGYPRGLAGESISLPARIFAVVDVFDALTSDRPYRSAWSAAKTLPHIRSLSGSHFDPRVVDCLEMHLSERVTNGQGVGTMEVEDLRQALASLAEA